jgi:hypothetical protein
MRIISKEMYPPKNDRLMQAIFVMLVPLFILEWYYNCTN